jgi:hypothetical protein
MTTDVRRYDQSDAIELGRLYSQGFGATARELFFGRWEWEFDRSPAIERFGNLVGTRDARVVAHIGRLPTRVALDGRIIPAAFLTDFVSDKDGGGILALRLVSESLRELPLALLFGGAPVTNRIYDRLGMRSVPIGPMLRRVDRPDGMLAWAAYRFVRRRRPALARLVRRWMFALPGALLAPLFARQYRWRSRLTRGPYRVEQLDAFDPRFDQLCEAMRRQFSASCFRDRAFLEWRYRQAPAGRYVIIAASDRGGELVAATVLSRVAVGPGTYGKFMECLYRDEDGLRAIVDGAMTYFRGIGVDVIFAIGLSRRARELLEEIGFRPAGPERPFRFKGRLSPEQERVLEDPDGWYISPGDGDEDFEETVVA